MKIGMQKLVVIYCLFLSVSTSIYSQKIDLKKIIQEHGKAIHLDQWKSVESYVMVTESKLDVGVSKLTSTMKRENNQYRLDFLTPDYISVKSFNGETGWLSTNGQVKDMSPGEAKEMAEEGQFYQELALAYEKNYSLTYLGEEDFNGKATYKIKMTKEEQDDQWYYLNKNTYLIEAVEEYSEDPQYEGIPFQTRFDDYQEIEGLMLPAQMTLYSNDKLLRTYTLTSLNVNTSIANTFFNPPNPWLNEKFQAKLEEFDFWLGDWEVFDASTKQLVGKSKIQKVSGGFGVMESFYGVPGPFHGNSINKYNFFKGQWEQYWIDNSGMSHFFAGTYSEETGMFLTKEDKNGENITYHRLVFVPQKDGSVRQTWTQSQDKESWAINFDGIYKKSNN